MYGKSENRVNYQRTARPIVAMAVDFPSGHRIAEHKHRRAQLVYAETGVMTVVTARGRWVVPPTRAVWIPPNTPHSLEISSQLMMRTIYAEPERVRGLPEHCAVVSVSSLLRELILAAVRIPNSYAVKGRDANLMGLILEEIATLSVTPLHLPMPSDPRSLFVAKHILAEPSAALDLQDYARLIGVGARTLARLFSSELGISFGRWHQQARLQASLNGLAKGGSVLEIALEVGYASPSAFAFAFRRCFGVAPSEYFAPLVVDHSSA